MKRIARPTVPLPDNVRCRYRVPKTGDRCTRRQYGGAAHPVDGFCKLHQNTVTVATLNIPGLRAVFTRVDLPERDVARLMTILREEFARLRYEASRVP
jgi:hypothetical protein